MSATNHSIIEDNDEEPTVTSLHAESQRHELSDALKGLFDVAASQNRDYKLIAALLDTIIEFVIETHGDVFSPRVTEDTTELSTSRQPSAQSAGSDLKLRPAFKARIEAVLDSWSDDEASWHLGIGVRQVRRRAQRGTLHFFEMGKRRRYPLWQFDSHGEVLPALQSVVRTFPTNWKPEQAWSFMNGRESGLHLHGEPLSPAEWLLLGNDPSRVTALISSDRAG